MDTTTFRILDIASAYLGTPLSINQVTGKIKEIYGTAHYANIYTKIHDLQKQSILNLNQTGKSSTIELNFRNYLLTDFLAEMEIKKKIDLLKRKNDLQILFTEMEKQLENIYAIKSICLADFESNIKLNRIELLFLLKGSDIKLSYQHDTAQIYNELRKLQDKHNLRIDALILNESNFFDLIKTDEINPLKEILPRKTAFFCPQAFWNQIKQITETGIKIKVNENQTNPTRISDADLTYNLARFGYKEFGPTIEQGQRICIEYIITTLLIQNDARRILAIPVILAKNSAKSNLIIFLSQKYEVSGRLLGLMRITHKIKPNKEIGEAIKLLEILNTKEIPTNEKDILQKMRLYNAA